MVILNGVCVTSSQHQPRAMAEWAVSNGVGAGWMGHLHSLGKAGSLVTRKMPMSYLTVMTLNFFKPLFIVSTQPCNGRVGSEQRVLSQEVFYIVAFSMFLML